MADSSSAAQVPREPDDASHKMPSEFTMEFSAVLKGMSLWLDELEMTEVEEMERKMNLQQLTALLKEHASRYDIDIPALNETSRLFTVALAEYNASEGITMRDAKQAARQHCKTFFKVMWALIGVEGLRECLGDVFPQQQQQQQQQMTLAESPNTATGPLHIEREPEPSSTTTPTATVSTELESEHAPDLAETERVEETDGTHAATAATTSATATVTATSKRPLSATEPDASSPFKRQHTGTKMDKDEPRTTTFDEVYQGGKAEIKYHIIEQIDEKTNTSIKCRFWILRCDKHNLHFAHSTGDSRWVFSAASKHAIKKHNLPGDNGNVLKHFGVAVRGCTAADAQKNNDSVVEACNNGYKPKTLTAKAQGAAAAAKHKGGGPFRSKGNRGGIRRGGPVEFTEDPDLDVNESEDNATSELPIAGHLYLAYWLDENLHEDWYAAVCLPVDSENFASVGLGKSLKTSGLLEQIPKCYEYDKTQDKVVGWKAGYKYGDRLVSKRKYPFFFFDSDHHVVYCGYGWVPVSHIKPFDLNGFNQKYLRALKTYLELHYQPPNTPRSLLPPPITRPDGGVTLEDQQPPRTPQVPADNCSASTSTQTGRWHNYQAPRVEEDHEQTDSTSTRKPRQEADSHAIPVVDAVAEGVSPWTAPKQSEQQSQHPDGLQSSGPAPTAQMSATDLSPSSDDDAVITDWRVLDDSKSQARQVSPGYTLRPPREPVKQSPGVSPTEQYHHQSRPQGTAASSSASNFPGQSSGETQNHQQRNVNHSFIPPLVPDGGSAFEPVAHTFNRTYNEYISRLHAMGDERVQRNT